MLMMRCYGKVVLPTLWRQMFLAVCGPVGWLQSKWEVAVFWVKKKKQINKINALCLATKEYKARR